MTQRSYLLILVLFLFNGCSTVKIIHGNGIKNTTRLVGAPNQVSIQLIYSSPFQNVDSLLSIATTPLPGETILALMEPLLEDTALALLAPVVTNSLSPMERSRVLKGIDQRNNAVILNFSLDTLSLRQRLEPILTSYNPDNPILPLFQNNPRIPDFTSLSKVTLLFPCVGISVPKKASRLPNAPREYRSGIHRGIDFFVSWGTPVQAVADGVIIRSDQYYEEIAPEFRESLLSEAAQIQHTPSDIFNSILVGRAVLIDHGLKLFPGYRAITIYAHLAYIDPRIKPGYHIKAGEVFGKTGNSGTSASTRGTREGSHLHWELILQDQGGEYFFGQGLPYPELYRALTVLFQ